MTKFYHHHLSNIGKCKIGEDCTIHSHVWIGDGVEIGDRVKIQAFAFIPPGVTIGDDVFIGPRVTFTNDHNPPSSTLSKTIVEDGVSIGAGAVIIAPCILKKGCKVGAGSVVTKDVPEGTLVMGNPAKPHGA